MWNEPRRIKIAQPGWENFTGQFGPVEFKDGVSVSLVDPIFIDRCAAEIKIVDAESDKPVGVQERLIEAKCVTLDVLDRLPRATDADVAPKSAPAPTPKPIEAAEEVVWTDEKLMAIADDKGIRGLREIGDPINAKGRAIPELIANILQIQDERARAAATRLPREG
jgi:hypothetical protein